MGNLMACTTFMAIRTYHDEKTKNEFLSDMPTTERTDVEWKRMEPSDLAKYLVMTAGDAKEQSV